LTLAISLASSLALTAALVARSAPQLAATRLRRLCLATSFAAPPRLRTPSSIPSSSPFPPFPRRPPFPSSSQPSPFQHSTQSVL
jgi:hypothetical protein